MRPIRAMRAMVVLSLVFTIAACGSSKKSSSGGPAAAADTVTIKSYSFKPNPVTVKAGATVTVNNTDDVDHTVTADDKKSFDTKHVAGRRSATFTAPTVPGTYAYHCNIHQFMTAKLIVT